MFSFKREFNLVDLVSDGVELHKITEKKIWEWSHACLVSLYLLSVLTLTWPASKIYILLIDKCLSNIRKSGTHQNRVNTSTK